MKIEAYDLYSITPLLMFSSNTILRIELKDPTPHLKHCPDQWASVYQYFIKHRTNWSPSALTCRAVLHRLCTVWRKHLISKWKVPSIGERSSTVSFKLLPLLNTRTVCHSLSLRFWPAKMVSGPLPAEQLVRAVNRYAWTHIDDRAWKKKIWKIQRNTNRKIWTEYD